MDPWLVAAIAGAACFTGAGVSWALLGRQRLGAANRASARQLEAITALCQCLAQGDVSPEQTGELLCELCGRLVRSDAFAFQLAEGMGVVVPFAAFAGERVAPPDDHRPLGAPRRQPRVRARQ